MRSISFLDEDWRESHPKTQWLYPLHWEEVANDKDKIKLNLMEDVYVSLADRGEFQCITVYDGDKAVGYHWSIIKPHLHYADSLTAFTDVYYLHPDYRQGLNGLNLFKAVEDAWRARGVQKAYGSSKLKLDKSIIYERLGWLKAETLYTKYLGD